MKRLYKRYIESDNMELLEEVKRVFGHLMVDLGEKHRMTNEITAVRLQHYLYFKINLEDFAIIKKCFDLVPSDHNYRKTYWTINELPSDIYSSEK